MAGQLIIFDHAELLYTAGTWHRICAQLATLEWLFLLRLWLHAKQEFVGSYFNAGLWVMVVFLIDVPEVMLAFDGLVLRWKQGDFESLMRVVLPRLELVDPYCALLAITLIDQKRSSARVL